MRRRTQIWATTLLAALTLAALTAAACANGDDGPADGPVVYTGGAAQGYPPANTILVTGAGSVEVTADIARLSLGVESIADTIAEARGEAASALDAMLAALKQHGVANDDIETAYFNIQPEYDYRSEGGPRLTGFRVSNFLNVTVRDLDTVGELIDAAVQAGGDSTRVNDIRFEAEEPEDAQREAWQLAVRDATAQADLLAAEAGVARGAPVLISSDQSSYSVPLARGEAAFADASFSTPILPGSLSIEARVTIAFAIGE